MVEKRGRFGRKNGKGFYDYPPGQPKKLWPGLAESAAEEARSRQAIDVEELKQRLLGMQALETARCFEEKVLTDVREADVGSILGFGFAPFSGGTLSWIDMMGTKKFVALCRKAGKEIRRALRAVEAAGRDGGQGRELLRPLRAEDERGGVVLILMARARAHTRNLDHGPKYPSPGRRASRGLGMRRVHTTTVSLFAARVTPV